MFYLYDVVNGQVVYRELPALIGNDNSINELSPTETGIVSGLTAVGLNLAAGVY